jgi:hypothetical protein
VLGTGGGVLGNKYLFLPPKKSLRYCTRLHGIPWLRRVGQRGRKGEEEVGRRKVGGGGDVSKNH